jgi:hypothetical protein
MRLLGPLLSGTCRWTKTQGQSAAAWFAIPITICTAGFTIYQVVKSVGIAAQSHATAEESLEIETQSHETAVQAQQLAEWSAS